MRLRDWLTTAAVLVVLSGCDFTGGGGGGGGGGGSGSFVFTEGFAFVHRNDRNVSVADKSDFQTSATLTTGANIFTPSLSKDGRKIVFARKNGTDSELAIVPSGGGSASVVLNSATATGTISNLRLPTFSPDGTTIVFAYDEGANPGAIGLVNADGSNFRKLIGGGSLAYGAPSFSNDGLSVVAAAGAPGSALTQLERISVSTSVATSITNDLTAAGAMDVANRVLVSPDGTRAVFDGHVSSGSTRIFVIDLLSKVVVKVNDYTNEPGTNDSAPCWVGNTKVAFSSDSGGNDNVYSVNADPTLGAALQLMVPTALEPSYGPL